MQEKIAEIKAFIEQKPWFDFELISYNNGNLLIGGSIDLHLYHELHIIFEDVFMFQMNLEWTVDTSSEIIKIVVDRYVKEINLAYQIEQGYQLFEFIPDKIPENTHFYISAQKIDYTIINNV